MSPKGSYYLCWQSHPAPPTPGHNPRPSTVRALILCITSPVHSTLLPYSLKLSQRLGFRLQTSADSSSTYLKALILRTKLRTIEALGIRGWKGWCRVVMVAMLTWRHCWLSHWDNLSVWEKPGMLLTAAAEHSALCWALPASAGHLPNLPGEQQLSNPGLNWTKGCRDDFRVSPHLTTH